MFGPSRPFSYSSRWVIMRSPHIRSHPWVVKPLCCGNKMDYLFLTALVNHDTIYWWLLLYNVVNSVISDCKKTKKPNTFQGCWTGRLPSEAGLPARWLQQRAAAERQHVPTQWKINLQYVQKKAARLMSLLWDTPLVFQRCSLHQCRERNTLTGWTISWTTFTSEWR